jgi:hypothetical protein
MIMNMDQSLVFYYFIFNWPYLIWCPYFLEAPTKIMCVLYTIWHALKTFCFFVLGQFPWENYLVGGTGYSTLQVCINGTISSLYYCTYEAAYTAISSMFDFRSFFNFTILSTSCTVILYTYACIGYLFCTCHFVPFQLFIIFK